MTTSRKLGILILGAVPAIVGGGIVYAIFGSYVPVFVYEVVLLLFMGSIISK